MTHPLARVLVGALGCVITPLAAAAQVGGGPPLPTRWDSAGVRVVESAAPAWTAGQEWTVDTVPALSLGVWVGDSTQIFSGDVAAALAPDGSVAVLNGEPRELRLFDPLGRHRLTFRGGGAWAFSGQSGASLAFGLGDTLVAFEGTKLYWFGIDGTPRRFLDLRGYVSGEPYLLPDGSLVRYSALPPEAEGGIQRLAHRLELMTDGGRRLLPITDVRGAETFGVEVSGPGSRRFGGVNPFGPRPGIAGGVTPFRVYVPDPELWAVRAYDRRGVLTEVYRPALPRTPITSEMIEEAREEIDAFYGTNGSFRAVRTRFLELFDELPARDSLPAIREVFWDSEGYLWLEHNVVTVTANPLPRTFEVLASDGTWMGRVEVPFYDVVQISNGRMLVRERDAQGFAYLRIYRIRRGEEP